MFGLDSVLSSLIERLSGGAKGTAVRDRTLLSTDRVVNYSMISLPIFLLAFTGLFTPSVFKFASINCAGYRYRSQATGEEVVSGNGNRHYFHKYCWERPLHHYPNTNFTDDSILWHKNFPYTLLIMTCLSSVPLLWWTFNGGVTIKPEVELFGEFLEALVKFLFRSQREGGTGRDFNVYRKQNDELIQGQFTTLARFMKTKSGGKWKLLMKLIIFRLLTLIALIGTIVLVYLTSIQKERSLFTCDVSFHDGEAGNESMVCSVQGVRIRLWLSWLWILGDGLLALLVIVGTLSDFRAMAQVHEKQRLMDMFKIIWPNKFLDANTAHGGADDLKYLTLLASMNLQGNL